MSKKKPQGKKHLLDLPQIEPQHTYLEYEKMTSFGKFANKVVGPFGPGMNVVYGENEAGKTTASEFIKAVLFGWPAARGQANPYRPEGAERVGSLFFRKGSEVFEVKRSKEAQIPEGLLGDIDKETYQTLFSLTSDELLGLDGHSNLTARLLTAGAGTPSSPAHALLEVERRIKEALSHSSQFPDSIPNLTAKLAALRVKVSEGRAEADSLRTQERELAALNERALVLSQVSAQLNGDIEQLKSSRGQLLSLEQSLDRARESLQAIDSASSSSEEAQTQTSAAAAGLTALSREDEERLRDELDALEGKREKLERSVDAARAAADRSQADFEVASEAHDRQGATGARKRQRHVIVGVCAVLSIGLLVAGIRIAIQALGLSYTAIGIMLIAFSLVIAAAGLALALHPPQDERLADDEVGKRRWVMEQDRKILAARQRELDEHESSVAAFLSEQGLAFAGGSIRRARRALDQLDASRAMRAANQQKEKAASLQQADLRRSIAELRRKRIELCRSTKLPDNAPLGAFDEALAEKETERNQTQRTVAETERRRGELSERLAAARGSMDFDRAKLEYEEASARLKAAQHSLTVLFIAQKTLQQAIAEWDRKSQPEVYRQASRLLSLMTDGAWVQVRLSDDGAIEAVDALRTALPPHLLSVGTRQQLYLSLRLALLITASDVGRGLPVVCDDILVNFDDARRVQAARALAELARTRQVVLFTCHKDVAALMGTVDPSSKRLEL